MFSVRWTFSLQMAPKTRREIQIAYRERKSLSKGVSETKIKKNKKNQGQRYKKSIMRERKTQADSP